MKGHGIVPRSDDALPYPPLPHTTCLHYLLHPLPPPLSSLPVPLRQDPVRVVKSLAYQLAASLPALAPYYCALDPGTLMQLTAPDAAARELLLHPLQTYARGQQVGGGGRWGRGVGGRRAGGGAGGAGGAGVRGSGGAGRGGERSWGPILTRHYRTTLL